MDKRYIAERKKAIVTDTMAYGIGGYISQVVGFFISIFMRRFLGPFYTGIWSLLKVVLSYSLFSDMGAEYALYYKVPLYTGKDDKKEVDDIQNIIWSFMAVVSVPVCVCILATAFLMRGRMPRELFVGFLIFPLIYVGQRFYTYLISLLRGRKKFTLLSKSYVFDSIVDLVLVIFLVSRFKLYGMYLVGILLPLLNIWYIQYKARFIFRFKLLWSKVKDYIIFGFPIFLTACMSIILYSVDRLMIAKMLGIVPLGYYSISIMSRTYTLSISKSFSSVISPYFIEDYGKTEDFSKVRHYVTTYTEIISCLIPLFLGLVYIVFPVLIYYLIPKFLPGINAMKTMLLSTFFILISWQLQNVLVLKKRQILMATVVFTAVAINILCNYACIKMNFGITGVAASSSFATFVVFTTFSVLAMHYLKSMNRLISFLTRIFTPLLLTILVVLLLEHLIIFANPIIESLLRFLLFLIYSSGVVLYLNKRSGLIGIVITILRERFTNERTDKP